MNHIEYENPVDFVGHLGSTGSKLQNARDLDERSHNEIIETTVHCAFWIQKFSDLADHLLSFNVYTEKL